MPNSPDILRLAASGIPLAEAARALGLDPAEALDQLTEAIKVRALVTVDADGQKQLELVHLDMLRQALTPSALAGDVTAARLLIRLHQARAALLGLSQPTMIISDETDREEEVDDLERIRAARVERRSST